MRKTILDAVSSAGKFALRNPLTVAKMALHAAGLRVAVPLDAIRWVVKQLPTGGKAPSDIKIEARPPAIHISAIANAMGTDVRASASIKIEKLKINADEATATIHLSDVGADVINNPNSPLKQLLDSGAIDLKKPANLVNFMPKKPPFLVSAKDSEVVIDLKKVPAFAKNAQIQKLLRTLTPVMTVSAVKTSDDLLLIALRAMPSGFGEMLAELRSK